MRIEEAQRFGVLLHGHLDHARDGLIAYMMKKHGEDTTRTYFTPPGTLPPHFCSPRSEWHFWQSVCTFERSKRKERYAFLVPALWTDLDPPDNLEHGDLEVWQRETYKRLTTFSPLPSVVVFSGRGWHGYWILEPPLRLVGPDRDHNIALVKAINHDFAKRLAGDAVGDLARVMRIPGTVNPKNGVTCRIIFSNGPIYDLADLADSLEVKETCFEPAPPETRTQKKPVPEIKAVNRRPGRPKLGVTVRDLRTLSPWARHLVMGGAWRSGKRYLKTRRRRA